MAVSFNITQAGEKTINEFPRYVQQQLLATPQERQQIRHNAALPKDAWIEIERNNVYPAFDDELTVFNDLRGLGLVSQADIMNKAVEWHKSDYSATAIVAMDPEVQGDEGQTEYDLTGSPLPLIMSEFSIGWREGGGDGGADSGQVGPDVDTLKSRGSARAIGEMAEDLTLNGWPATLGIEDSYSMYGLTNHPEVHEGTLDNWETTPEQVRPNLKTMARDLKDDEFSGPFMVYIGSELEDVLSEPDPEGTGDMSLRQRLDPLNDYRQIKVADKLASDAVLMFEPRVDVVDLAIGLEEQMVQWEDPWRDQFQAIMGFTPRVKSTMRNQCGIAYYTGGLSA